MLTLVAQAVNDFENLPWYAQLAAILLFQTVLKSFYLLTLTRAVCRCRREHRSMSPALLWLYLLPILDIIWHFVVVSAVSRTLRREFQSRGLGSRNDDCGQGQGTLACLVFLFANVLSGLRMPVCFLAPVALLWLVLWIRYWITIASYSSRLVRHEETHGTDEAPRDRVSDYPEFFSDESAAPPPGPQ